MNPSTPVAPLFAPFAITLLLALSGCSKPVQEAESVRPVLVTKVSTAAGANVDVYSGELRARYETELGFRTPGKIAARLVNPGERVKKGQTLARLDPQDAKLQAQSARAQTTAAQSELQFAKAELDRYADLLGKNFISKAQFDGKQNTYNAALARLDQARAAAGISANQESYSTLSADADGLITHVLAEAGQVVSAGMPVVRLAKDGERDVVISVPENKLERFKAGAEVAIALWSNGAAHTPGRVREINAGADPATRTYQVKVTALALPPEAQIGMTASVVQKQITTTTVLLPLSALTKKGDQAAVWIVDPATNKVALRAVKVSEYGESGAKITEGVQDGELVVAAGVHKLKPDQQVTISQPGKGASLDGANSNVALSSQLRAPDFAAKPALAPANSALAPANSALAPANSALAQAKPATTAPTVVAQ